MGMGNTSVTEIRVGRQSLLPRRPVKTSQVRLASKKNENLQKNTENTDYETTSKFERRNVPRVFSRTRDLGRMRLPFNRPHADGQGRRGVYPSTGQFLNGAGEW